MERVSQASRRVRGRALFAGALSAVALASQSCGGFGPPVDVSGMYTVAVTNNENGCMLPNWTQGDTANNIDFTVTQATGAAEAQGTVGGLTGIALNLVFGSNRFAGTVAGNVVTMTLQGTRAGSAGSCAFTGVVELRGTLTGNALQGTLDWRYSTNRQADCGYRDTCSSRQTFSGARPPR